METFSALLALCAGNSPVPVNSPHKGQWRGALMFSLICARMSDWVNNCEAGDLRRPWSSWSLWRQRNELGKCLQVRRTRHFLFSFTVISDVYMSFILNKIRFTKYCLGGFQSSSGHYIRQILWGVITCPCPWFLLLAQQPSYINTPWANKCVNT